MKRNKMTQTIKAAAFALLATLIFSCKTLKVSTDYDRSADFSAYKTFSIYRVTTTPDVNQLNAERIWNSIRAEMSKKGYTEDNYYPDLVIDIAGLLQTQNRKFISASGAGYYRPWWGNNTATIQDNDYKEGSLLIHVIDVKKKKLVWEGKGNAEITKQPKNPDEAISRVVTKIMNNFPMVTEN